MAIESPLTDERSEIGRCDICNELLPPFGMFCHPMLAGCTHHQWKGPHLVLDCKNGHVTTLEVKEVHKGYYGD